MMLLERLNLMNSLKKLTLLRLLLVVILSKKLTMKQKLVKLEKIADHDHSNKYNTIQEFNNLTAESFAARLVQGNLASKNDLLLS